MPSTLIDCLSDIPFHFRKDVLVNKKVFAPNNAQIHLGGPEMQINNTPTSASVLLAPTTLNVSKLGTWGQDYFIK